MEFTGAGLLNQSELLLIGRDPQAIAHYLPKLRRCANFIETRRDPSNNLFLAGPAANLLGPSYAGWKKPDGTFDKAYLTGLSITYIGALDRLIELEKLAGDPALAQLYTERGDCVFTCKRDGTIFAIELAKDDRAAMPEEIVIPAELTAKADKITLLGFAGELSAGKTQDSQSTIVFPDAARAKPPCAHAWAIRLATRKTQ